LFLDRDVGLAEKVLATLKGTKGGHQAAFIDVLDKAAVQQAADKVIKEYGKIDGLINGAGGNNPKATTNPEQSFFRHSARSHPVRVDPEPCRGPSCPVGPSAGAWSSRRKGVILNISVNECLPAAHQDSRVFCGQGRCKQFHPVVGGAPGTRVFGEHPGERQSPRDSSSPSRIASCSPTRRPGGSPARGHKIIDTRPWPEFGNARGLGGRGAMAAVRPRRTS